MSRSGRAKRTASRRRATYGIRPHHTMTPDEAAQKRELELRAPGITQAQADELSDLLSGQPVPAQHPGTEPNDGRCHATTKKGARCKRTTDGRWCSTHRQDH